MSHNKTEGTPVSMRSYRQHYIITGNFCTNFVCCEGTDSTGEVSSQTCKSLQSKVFAEPNKFCKNHKNFTMNYLKILLVHPLEMRGLQMCMHSVNVFAQKVQTL